MTRFNVKHVDSELEFPCQRRALKLGEKPNQSERHTIHGANLLWRYVSFSRVKSCLGRGASCKIRHRHQDQCPSEGGVCYISAACTAARIRRENSRISQPANTFRDHLRSILSRVLSNLKQMATQSETKHVAARLLMALLFLVSGISKLGAVEKTQQYMEAYGVPGYLIWPAAALEINGGLLLVLGIHVRTVAIAFAMWCLLTAAIFHVELQDQTQQIMFLKNITMAGGFLVVAKEMENGLPQLGMLNFRAYIHQVLHFPL